MWRSSKKHNKVLPPAADRPSVARHYKTELHLGDNVSDPGSPHGKVVAAECHTRRNPDEVDAMGVLVNPANRLSGHCRDQRPRPSVLVKPKKGLATLDRVDGKSVGLDFDQVISWAKTFDGSNQYIRT